MTDRGDLRGSASRVQPDPVLRRLAIVGWLLAAATLTLGVTALWLATDNPEIRHTSRGDLYPCLAPWDTVVNDADNRPGGEPAPDEDDINARCRAAGEDRFDQAEAFAIAAGVAAVAAIGVTYARGRRDRRLSW